MPQIKKLADGKDKYAVACNLSESISEASKGALAYVVHNNPGGGGDRQMILLRSRSGRWIQKWESAKRLTNFRVKTIPPEHPMWSDAWWSCKAKTPCLFDSRDAAEAAIFYGPNKKDR